MAQKFKDAFQKMAQNIPKGGGAGGAGGGKVQDAARELQRLHQPPRDH